MHTTSVTVTRKHHLSTEPDGSRVHESDPVDKGDQPKAEYEELYMWIMAPD